MSKTRDKGTILCEVRAGLLAANVVDPICPQTIDSWDCV